MIEEGLTFDDVLLKPKYSNIKTRTNVDISVKLPKLNHDIDHPIIPANMQSIMGYDMAKAIYLYGGLGILHRFMPLEDQINILLKLEKEFDKNVWNNIGFSIGVKGEDYDNLPILINAGAKILCIDVAHGHSELCRNMCEYISGKYPNILLIAGNVSTDNGAYDLWEAGADIVKVGIGGGCFGAKTRILMSNGFYKNIEEIKIGDFVINKDGKAVKVINAFCTGIKKVSKLKNNSFYNDTYVTPDHKFWIGDLSSASNHTISTGGYKKLLDIKSETISNKYKWKELKTITNDVFLFPKDIEFKMPDNFDIILNKRNSDNWYTKSFYIEDSHIVPNYDSGYLFGTFLGDEYASCTIYKNSHIGAVTWSFGINEIDIAQKLSNCINNIFNKMPKLKYTDNTIEVKFYYKPLADFLLSFGRRKDKHLPEHLFVNNKKYLQGIYDGLLDGNVSYSKDGGNSFSNTSIKIIEIFNIINVILYNYLPNNSLISCNKENLNDVFVSRTLKSPNSILAKNYYIVKNMGYENLELQIPVYDITVECDSHSFIANNMIVHNSLCTTRIETGNGVPQLTALKEAYEAKDAFLSQRCGSRDNRNILIISDGGVKNSGDITKALCYADMVMVGNLFSGCTETPATSLVIDNIIYKEYAGSSTHKTNHIEGVVALVPAKGNFDTILIKILEGIKSGCSYQGVDSINKLKDNPTFIKITNAGLRESHPHDVKIIK